MQVGNLAELPLEEPVDRSAGEQGADAGGGGGAGDDEAEDEGGEDSGGDVALEFLDEFEDAAFEDGGEGDGAADQKGDDRGDAADGDEACFAGRWVQVPLVEIHGEDGGGGVQHRGERADDRAGDGGQDEAAEAAGNQLANQGGVGLVGAGQGVAVELLGDDAGHDDGEGDQEPESACEDDAELALLQGARRQRALDDELVEAAVVEVGNPHAADQDGPGQLGVVARQDHVQLVGVGRVEGGGAADGA